MESDLKITAPVVIDVSGLTIGQILSLQRASKDRSKIVLVLEDGELEATIGK